MGLRDSAWNGSTAPVFVELLTHIDGEGSKATTHSCNIVEAD